MNRRRFGFARTSGSGPPNDGRVPALGTSSLRSSPPNAGAGSPFNAIEFLSTAIGSHLLPPYCNSKGCGCLTDVGREGKADGACVKALWIQLRELKKELGGAHPDVVKLSQLLPHKSKY